MSWAATILTLYPEMFPGPLGHSLAGRALAEGIWSLDTVQIRDFATDRHRSVDDTPAGGGAGMVMRADVLAAALDSVARRPARRSWSMTPARARRSPRPWCASSPPAPASSILCGRFEGIDERLVRGAADRPGLDRRLCAVRRRDRRLSSCSMLAFGCFPG